MCLKKAMLVCVTYHLITLLTWYNMKKESYILPYLKGKIGDNIGVCCTYGQQIS
jgi:hypothetical protein